MRIVPKPNRWLIAGAATVVMLTIGAIYSWAIFTQPLLVAFGWDLTTTTWAYAIANFSLAAVGAVIGGFWQDRVGPRTVAMVGVALWGCGNVLAGLGTSMFGAPWLYVSYGVLGGIGAGMAYITPVSMVTKWFPDKKGLAGGLVVGGFGLGAFVYNQWIPRLRGFHSAAVHADGFLAARTAAKSAGTAFGPTTLTAAQTFTKADISAVMHIFIASGLVFLIVGLTAASLFRNPPHGYSPPGRGRTVIASAGGGYSPSQALATPQFYLLWLQLFVNVIAGITIISNAVCILTDLTKMSAAAIAPLFGLVTIFNALGRPLWGAISDRIGCNRTFAALFVIQAVTLLLLANVHELMPALAAVAVILLCCGGGFGTMPSFNAACLGTKFVGLNYGLILSAWGCAGLIGPIVAARARDVTGSFAGMLPLVAVALMISVVLPFITKKPAQGVPAATTVAPRRYRLPGAHQREAARSRCLAAVTLASSTLLLTPATAKTPIHAADATVASGYGRLPLAFEQNRGQTDSQVKFLARGAGYALFLTPSEAVLKIGALQGADRDAGVLRVRLVGANSNAVMAGEAALPGHSNYFLGDDPSKWQTQVEQFATVRYRKVYPGIDLYYYGNQQQLEYDFVVAPGADPDVILMDYRGAQQISIDAHGDLRIKTASGEITQRRPMVYQTINARKKWVASRFKLERHGPARQVAFTLASYDRSVPLVIDPVLVYSSFLGGTGEDAVLGIAVDPSGSVTVVGSTQSVDFPTHGALVATNSNQTDGFVTKFNPAGNALVYSTYLGTLASCPPAPCPITQATAVAVDATGNAYVTRRTQAHDFPTHAAHQPLFGGGPFDIFVTKLTPDGSALVYSTYLGGNETDQATGIAVDAAGSAYVTGCNALGNFPTQNPYQSTNRANATCTGILTKFMPDGSGLIYSTYFGGTGQDMPLGIAVDSSGNAYIAGSTSSTDLPTKNPIQPTNLGVFGLTGFVTEFNSSGSALVYSTYLGGSSAGQVNAIAVDGTGNTYVVGQTQAADFPIHNAFLATNTGDGFVSVLAPGGTSFIYSTYFPALPTALAVDGSGDAYFAGANNPAIALPTQNPIQATSHVARNNTVGTNAFVAEFNPAGSALLFSTYLGGSDSDIANAIAVDASENIYVAGSALSPDFPGAAAKRSAAR